MEVHAHPSSSSGYHSSASSAHRKKFIHYLWEFLMLFLAVFAGFMAENFREHILEKKREKQFIVSLTKDVELDIASLKLSSNVKRGYCNYFDSLVYLLQNNAKKLNDIYFYARHLGRITEFKYHDRTIQELKSTGSLRLISNKEAADSITVYDNEIARVVLDQQEIEHQLRNDIMATQIGKVFDGFVWNDLVDSTGHISRISNNPELATRDPKLINDLIVHIVHLKTSYRLTEGEIEKTIKAAENLVAFLKKEYRLR